MDITNKWIERDGLKVLILRDVEIEQLYLLNEADALIIVHTNQRLTEFFLDTIRSNEDEIIFLKPLFVYSNVMELPKVYKSIVDGEMINIDQSFPELIETVNRIQEIVKKLVPVKALNFDSSTINKVLRFYYSRGIKQIVPILDRKAKLGYSYPLISQHFSNQDDKNVLDLLKLVEEEGYVVGEHQDSLYLCSHCYNSYLFYREVCPKCSSTNLKQDDLIHHFRCAYIGPMVDFTSEVRKNDLICPKCDKSLKHIGVDYDKPSVVYTCNTCDHIFQDVQIKAKCCECEKDTEVEHLLNRSIKKYAITSKGFYTAQNGIMSTQKDLAGIAGTVSMETFTTMLSYEIERMKIAEIESSLGFIRITNVIDLYLQVGNESKHNLIMELVRIIRSAVRNSDVIAFESASTMMFSLTEINGEDAKRTVRKIGIMIRRLVRDNVNGFHAEIEYGVHPLDKSISYSEQIASLTRQAHAQE